MNWNPLIVPLIHSVETVLLVVWLTYIYRTLTGEKVTTINSISPQAWGIVMMILGFAMLVACKMLGIDTTIAGGVIGAGVNMLTGKHPGTDPTTLPPGSTLQSTQQETLTAQTPSKQ